MKTFTKAFRASAQKISEASQAVPFSGAEMIEALRALARKTKKIEYTQEPSEPLAANVAVLRLKIDNHNQDCSLNLYVDNGVLKIQFFDHNWPQPQYKTFKHALKALGNTTGMIIKEEHKEDTSHQQDWNECVVTFARGNMPDTLAAWSMAALPEILPKKRAKPEHPREPAQ